VKRTAALLLAAMAAGCGGQAEDDPGKVLSDTAGKLPKIRSGDLRFDLRARGRERKATSTIGFTLAGPFKLAENGGLPTARLRYTQRSGTVSESATLLSTGQKVFVQGKAGTAPLPAAQAQKLRGAASTVGKGGGVRVLRLDRWLRHPKLSAGPKVAGAETDRVTAGVDVVRALRDVGGLPGGDRSSKDLQKALGGARAEVLTGRDDRLLRRLTFDLELKLDVPERLRGQLGRFAGGDLHLVFEVGRPNRPPRPSAPAVTATRSAGRCRRRAPARSPIARAGCRAARRTR
jgi:hypothetical protein